MAIEKDLDIDELVQKLYELELINVNMILDGKGKLDWVVKFDGEIFNIRITHVNES